MSLGDTSLETQNGEGLYFSQQSVSTSGCCELWDWRHVPFDTGQLKVRKGVCDLSGSSDIAKSCCFHYGHKMLPWTWVQNYAYNGSSCPSMLFTTKRGERICAHPRKKWVQRYISLLVTQKQ
ncbi:LOW QUALITY PROTEIN: C-C motif chemokine 26 [Microcebus murinus]|uniref:LOW QUALITY PROTEIN: C-C motif chemokine 26 n=1 Tax=Microcebus murinus TaxID=30608 RepID=UPI003F6CFF8C